MPWALSPCRGPALVDIIVIGGGALGGGAALALAEEDHDVTLVERATLGAGASAKAAGVVSTMTWNDEDYRLIAETRGRVGELISLVAGVEPAARGAWTAYDSIVVAKGDKLRALDAMQDRLERFTEEPERLGWREAAAAFPGVRFGPGEEALVAQEDGVLEAGDFLAALRARLDQEGVTVRENAPITVAEARAETEGIVVAGGAWTRGLLAEAGVALPLQAFRTQAASVPHPSPHELPIVHDAVHGFYARPESEASVLAGDGTVLEDHDPDGYDERGDPAFVDRIAAGLSQRFEGFEQANIRSTWAGLCVSTPDARPLCGPVPGEEGLWVLTGDNGYGLMRSLALGHRLAQAVDGDVDPGLDPGRFGDDWDPDFPMREGFGF